MKGRKLLLAAVAVTLTLAAASSSAAAQDIDHSIEFEEPVVAGEETTFTFTGTVHDPTVETEVNADVEFTVDGEVVDERSYSMEMYDGVELHEEFTHAFDSAGEHEVGFTFTFSVFGQSRTASFTETVTVQSPEASAGIVEVTPDEPGVVEVGTTVGGVTVEDVTVHSTLDTTVQVDFEDRDTAVGPDRSLRVAEVNLEGENVSRLTVSFSSESEAEVHLQRDGEWSTEDVDLEGDGFTGSASIDEPVESTTLAFVDVSPEEEDDDNDELEDEGLPGFTAVAALLALTAFALAARAEGK